ncbi:MAG TPA: response regulator transcription factor [Pseudogracilibacillus sp.]|nr:response regulator transcription factor [Pseudogracilibacillus sp.]
MKNKILVVDDEVSIVTLLTYNLEKAGYLTSTAFDGKEAIQKAKQDYFDLILLDVMLPKMDGLEVCKFLRNNKIETPIIMLTALSDEFDKILGLELGADDYITKPFSPREVLTRIKVILRRINKVTNQLDQPIKFGDLIIFPDRYEAEINQKTISFTRKEFELLVYLAEHKNIVLSRDQLLNAVWDYDFAGDTRIVDVHISRLREKIEENTKKPVYIKTVHGLGYKIESS